MTLFCLTIAGSDPTSGAGIQADIRTFDRIGVHPFSVITALTYQSATKFYGFNSLSDDLEKQLDAILKTYHIKYVKIGMIPDIKAVNVIAEAIKKHDLYAVLDPVTISSAGERLSNEGLEQEIKEKLFPLVKVLTPNLDEAMHYAEINQEKGTNLSEDHLKEMALSILRKMYVKLDDSSEEKAVIIKSAIIKEEEIFDLILIKKKFTSGHQETFKIKKKRRIAFKGNIHGTGCVFSSAITAFLVKGHSLQGAIDLAEDFFDEKFQKFIELPEHGMVLDLTLSQEKIDVINQIKEIYHFISDLRDFTKLIPEVRLNISGSLPNAIDKEDIAGIEGRITVINGYPHASGEIKFGVSDHTARLILTAKEHDNSINFVTNLRYKEQYIRLIQEKTDLYTHEFIRETQPDMVRNKEHSTMQWLIKECIDKTSRIPDIVWDKGAMGKEPIIRIFAKNSRDMIEKLKIIIKTVL